MRERMRTHVTMLAAAAAMALVVVLVACSSNSEKAATGEVRQATASPGTGGASLPILPGDAGFDTVSQLPKDPSRDPLPADEHVAEQVKLGFQIMMDTPTHAGKYTGNQMSCTNCHLNAGQKELAFPLVGIAAAFPEYTSRNDKLRSLEDRIVGCFSRSENAPEPPPSNAPEVLAVAAYITWISEGQPLWQDPEWRGKNTIAKENRIAIEDLDVGRGQELYNQQCASCHGDGGQGMQLGEVKPGPLWGDGSWNDGAGAGRIYTLAGFLRYAMPYSAPGSLTDEEAQLIAAFIDSHDRPEFAGKENDYPTDGPPVDAVYYPQRYPTNPLKK